MNIVEKEEKLAAPCGLYCGVCFDYLIDNSCHGCGCECGECAASYHHEECGIYNCCVKQRGHKACYECEEFPCSIIIRFCHDPAWLTHSIVLDNLRRRKAIGTQNWVREQRKAWSNKRYLRRWLWFQKECSNRWKRSQKESKEFLSDKE